MEGGANVHGEYVIRECFQGNSAELKTHLERTRRTRLSDEIKVSLALLVVIAVFVISWAPISLVNALETFQLAAIPRPVERQSYVSLLAGHAPVDVISTPDTKVCENW